MKTHVKMNYSFQGQKLRKVRELGLSKSGAVIEGVIILLPDCAGKLNCICFIEINSERYFIQSLNNLKNLKLEL